MKGGLLPVVEGLDSSVVRVVHIGCCLVEHIPLELNTHLVLYLHGYLTFAKHRLEFLLYNDLGHFDLAICEFLNALQHKLLSLCVNIRQRLLLGDDKTQYDAIR